MHILLLGQEAVLLRVSYVGSHLVACRDIRMCAAPEGSSSFSASAIHVPKQMDKFKCDDVTGERDCEDSRSVISGSEANWR